MFQLRDKHTQRNGSSMWHFCGKLFENAGHAIFKIIFSKTEDRNQWHHDPESVYNTPGSKMYPRTKSGIQILHEIQNARALETECDSLLHQDVFKEGLR